MKRKNEITRESAKLHGMTNNHQNDGDPLRNIDPINTLCLSVCLSVKSILCLSSLAQALFVL